MKPIRTEPFFQITIEAPFLTQIFPFFRENNLPFETGFLLPEKLTFFLPELKQFFFLLPTLRQQMRSCGFGFAPSGLLTLPSAAHSPKRRSSFSPRRTESCGFFSIFSDAESVFWNWENRFVNFL